MDGNWTSHACRVGVEQMHVVYIRRVSCMEHTGPQSTRCCVPASSSSSFFSLSLSLWCYVHLLSEFIRWTLRLRNLAIGWPGCCQNELITDRERYASKNLSLPHWSTVPFTLCTAMSFLGLVMELGSSSTSVLTDSFFLSFF
jgi:hypothetical protein